MTDRRAMSDVSYHQFCPVAMAAEILCPRWTLLLLRELVAGSKRFNELRRGLPRMSPALLSKRLKDLEAAGVITRTEVREEPGVFDYGLTDAGRDLEAVIEAIGIWGQRWIETEATLKNLDVNLLMWDMRRNIDPTPLPPHRSTIQIIFSELPAAQKNWWLIVDPVCIDLCSVDPGFDVDLYLATDLRTMTEVWMGLTTVVRARESGKLVTTGNRQLEAHLETWLCLSRFARTRKLVA
jgi:DNA-binding HxlR family transcriptional regulator